MGDSMLTSILTMILSVFYAFLKVNDGNSFPPPLPADKEREYFRLAKKGDMKARELLIEHNLRLVAHIVKKYYGSGPNQEDLISIGTIGLIKAIDSFDPENGARFATYAGKCLQNEILMHFRAQKKCSQEVSIHETIDVDKDGNPLTYMDIVAVDDTIAEDIYTKISSGMALRYIQNALEPRERQIIVLRYGLGNRPAITQREIAAKLGISRSYVSRLEKSALSKIRRYLCENGG